MSLFRDVRYAVRSLLRAPALTAVTFTILTLGIGANATIFTLVDRLFLAPPPGIAGPERLVRLGRFDQENPEAWWGYPDFAYFRERNQAFSDLAAYSPRTNALTAITGDRPVRVSASFVSTSYFTVLGVRAAVGQTFLPEKRETPGSPSVAVVSHGFWRRALAGEPGAVGSILRLNGHPVTVLGVAPPELQGVSPVEEIPDVWVPLTLKLVLQPDGGRSLLMRIPNEESTWLQVVGRLRPGMTVPAAQARLDNLSAALARDFPESVREGQGVKVLPSFQRFPGIHDQLARLLRLLSAVVALVLLVASANVAILLLARAIGRSRDLGVRVALGASRRRIAWQLLLEGLLLAIAGGAAGYLLAFWSAGLAAKVLPFQLAVKPVPDLRVLGFTLGVAVLAALLFGMAPALQARRVDMAVVIKEGEPASGRSPWLNVLVTIQVALSIVLATGALLFVRSLRAAESVDLGFATEGRLLVTVDLAHRRYGEEGIARFLDQALERVSALPGVRRASAMLNQPFGSSWRTSLGEPPDEGLTVSLNGVGPGYFEAMGIPLLAGRGFGPQDRTGSSKVAVLNQAAAEKLFPGAPAVGLTFQSGSLGTVTVVGLARNAQYHDLGEDPPLPHVYLPFVQTGRERFHLLVQTAGEPEALARPVEEALYAIDPYVTMAQTRTMGEAVEKELVRYRVSATLVTLFAVLALALAAVGLYGVLSYLVARRRRVLGIQMALGATAQQLVRSVLRRGLVLAGTGIVLGMVAAWWASRWVASFLFEIDARDPVSFLAVPVVLVAVACLSSLIPALRAARVDPAGVLREE